MLSWVAPNSSSARIGTRHCSDSSYHSSPQDPLQLDLDTQTTWLLGREATVFQTAAAAPNCFDSKRQRETRPRTPTNGFQDCCSELRIRNSASEAGAIGHDRPKPLIRARSVVQVDPGPPSKSPVNTRRFSLFPSRRRSLKNRFVNRLSTSRLAGCHCTQGVPRQSDSGNHAARARSSEITRPEEQKRTEGWRPRK